LPFRQTNLNAALQAYSQTTDIKQQLALQSALKFNGPSHRSTRQLAGQVRRTPSQAPADQTPLATSSPSQAVATSTTSSSSTAWPRPRRPTRSSRTARSRPPSRPTLAPSRVRLQRHSSVRCQRRPSSSLPPPFRVQEEVQRRHPRRPGLRLGLARLQLGHQAPRDCHHGQPGPPDQCVGRPSERASERIMTRRPWPLTSMISRLLSPHPHHRPRHLGARLLPPVQERQARLPRRLLERLQLRRGPAPLRREYRGCLPASILAGRAGELTLAPFHGPLSERLRLRLESTPWFCGTTASGRTPSQSSRPSSRPALADVLAFSISASLTALM
jgi:hypothetical protein